MVAIVTCFMRNDESKIAACGGRPDQNHRIVVSHLRKNGNYKFDKKTKSFERLETYGGEQNTRVPCPICLVRLIAKQSWFLNPEEYAKKKSAKDDRVAARRFNRTARDAIHAPVEEPVVDIDPEENGGAGDIIDNNIPDDGGVLDGDYGMDD